MPKLMINYNKKKNILQFGAECRKGKMVMDRKRNKVGHIAKTIDGIE